MTGLREGCARAEVTDASRGSSFGCSLDSVESCHHGGVWGGAAAAPAVSLVALSWGLRHEEKTGHGLRAGVSAPPPPATLSPWAGLQALWVLWGYGFFLLSSFLFILIYIQVS